MLYFGHRLSLFAAGPAGACCCSASLLCAGKACNHAVSMEKAARRVPSLIMYPLASRADGLAQSLNFN